MLRTQLAVVRRRLPIVLLVTILSVVAATTASLVLPKTFESQATLLIGNIAGSSTPSVDQAEVAQRVSVTYANVATQRATLQRVIDKLRLDTDPDELVKDVKAEAPAESSIVTITVENGDRETAAAIANAIAEDVQASTPAITGHDPELQQFIRDNLVRVQQEISDTQEEIDTLTALPERDATQDARLSSLETRLANVQSSFATLLALTSGASASQATLSDPAVPADDPISPNLPLGIALGLLLGIIFALIVAFVLDQWDDSVRDEHDLERVTGLATLGQIGRAHIDHGKSKIYWLAALLTPRSAVAEAYRTLRTNLDFVTVDGPAKTVLVTSAVPSDGKTTVAANLAVAFAQAGRRTILVDADLRKPTIHELFGIERVQGLTTAATGQRSSVAKFIVHTDQEGLSVLPAGPVPPNPTELLGTQWFRTVLEDLAEHADVVVLDSPPVAIVSDAAVLSSVVDVTLLVVRAGRTSRDAVEHAVDTLNRSGGRVAGAVLNDASRAYADVYGGYYVEGSAPPPLERGQGSREPLGGQEPSAS